MASLTLPLLILTLLSIQNAKCQFPFELPPSLKPAVEVQGLKVGDVIKIQYLGVGISQVTLSVEDDIGKGLHMEARHNVNCDGNEENQKVILNTRTNGMFDINPQRERFPGAEDIQDLRPQYWSVTAEKDSYKIEHLKKIHREFQVIATYTFPYRPPHVLENVKVIKLYAKPSCGDTDFFYGELKLEVPAPSDVSKVSVELGGGMIGYDHPKVFFKFGNGPKALFDINEVYLHFMYHEYRYSKLIKLTQPFTPKTKVYVTLERLPNNVYQYTMEADGQQYRNTYTAASSDQLTALEIKAKNIIKFDFE